LNMGLTDVWIVLVVGLAVATAAERADAPLVVSGPVAFAAGYSASYLRGRS